jgi:acetylornithine deacetylase/succinyl-diaminopimelate desuccinylase-like protein
MNREELRSLISARWRDVVLPALCEYISIPNQSPAFDPEWASNGLLERAVRLAREWAQAQGVEGLHAQILALPGRTPLLLLEAGGSVPGNVLFYGHLDKQPPFEGWRQGLGPFVPVIEGERLYGRGGADDGYAVFAIVTAWRALLELGGALPRCIALIECSEESGSGDLEAYVEHLRERIGQPDLVVCLDSGCGDYERLWATVSLRGLVNGVLRVRVLEEGVHSGAASGVVPSTFRIARQLLSRIEDESDGRIRVASAWASIPEHRIEEARQVARVAGEALRRAFPFLPGVRPVSEDPLELVLNRTWRPQLEVVGANGLPPAAHAGNVLRPVTELKLSLRLPPRADAKLVAEEMKQCLEHEPPYGAQVEFAIAEAASGWDSPPLRPALHSVLADASESFWGAAPCFMGEGGTIPFMGMLAALFPRAQFVVTGVLGPHSNAHGPNEFLHLPTAEKITCALALLLSECPKIFAAPA